MSNRIREIKPKKKKSGASKYLFYFLLVIGLTALSLTFSFYSAGDGNIYAGVLTIGDAILSANYVWMIVIAVLLIFLYVIHGLIIQVFCRLYTRHYRLHQGVANALVGAFYNNVTPGQTGGQVMQAYTMKSQGVEISNAASIMVMWFILYQTSLIIYDSVALGVEWNTLLSIRSITIPGFSIGSWNGELSMFPLIALGFVVNIVIILFLFFMSYSRRLHNFFSHYVIGLLGKLKIIRNVEKTRDSLRVQVENFKIELRRLQSNIPVTILVIVLFLIAFTITYSIPYFAGLALDAYGYGYTFSVSHMFDCCFRSVFQQMVSGLVPLPGNAGVSELVFTAMFNSVYQETAVYTEAGLTVIRSASANVMAAQILWRFSTYYFVLIISGLVSALYHSRGGESFRYASRQTFVDLQLSTYDERRASSDTMYETKQLSKKEVRQLIQNDRDSLKNGTWAIDTGDDFIGPLPSKKRKQEREFTVDDLGEE